MPVAQRIDLSTWPRREHYAFFREFVQPIFSVTVELRARVDVPRLRGAGVVTPLLCHSMAAAAHDVDAFRYRQRQDEVVLWDTVSPSLTLLDEHQLFKFCLVPFTADFPTFVESYRRLTASAHARPDLDDPAQQDDAVLFTTQSTIFAFTGLTHPIKSDPPDSIPRMAWGKMSMEGDELVLPFNMQLNHWFIDGIHVGRFLESFRKHLEQTAAAL